MSIIWINTCSRCIKTIAIIFVKRPSSTWNRATPSHIFSICFAILSWGRTFVCCIPVRWFLKAFITVSKCAGFYKNESITKYINIDKRPYKIILWLWNLIKLLKFTIKRLTDTTTYRTFLPNFFRDIAKIMNHWIFCARSLIMAIPSTWLTASSSYLF